MDLLVHASVYPDRCPLESIVDEKYYVFGEMKNSFKKDYGFIQYDLSWDIF